MEHWLNYTEWGERELLGETYFPVRLFPTKIPYGLGSNSGLRSDRPATNFLSHGTETKN